MTINTKPKIAIGTRRSRLAMWQTDHVIDRLRDAWPDIECIKKTYVTEGDTVVDVPLPKIGGKGLFTARLEQALHEGDIDIAVHSLKDLPVDDAPGTVLGAILSRADTRDALVAREGWTLETLPRGAVVGTSSIRRQSQLLIRRPDLRIKDIRGNVETRIRKVHEGDYDATVLAGAGLERLGLSHHITDWLALDVMLPAPGQGALAVQCRASDDETLAALAPLNDDRVRAEVQAERAFLAGLGGGCSLPIAAHATSPDDNDPITLVGLVTSPDGRDVVRVQGVGKDPSELGRRLAASALEQGATPILRRLSPDVSGGADPGPKAGEGPLQGKPLTGRRVVVTRPAHQSREACEHLTRLGAKPVPIAAIRIEVITDTARLDEAIQNLQAYDWTVFTSANAVDVFWQRARVLGFGEPPFGNVHIAAVGTATAEELAECGAHPSFVPTKFVGEQIAVELEDLEGKRILLPRAEGARDDLPRLLEARGARVDDIPIYRSVPTRLNSKRCAEITSADAVIFTSGSTVRSVVSALQANDYSDLFPHQVVIGCIGPVTARIARDAGLHVAVVPAMHTMSATIDALAHHFTEGKEA